tara:strand:- start:71 stop:778 length:708 start_codon:yes stop_codon:yes gene_type:complete
MNSINDNNITLIEETHKYILKTMPDIKFQSVTTILDKFFEPFDEKKIAEKLCKTSPKYMGMRPEQLIASWHKLRDHGSNVHKEIELFLENKTQPSELKARLALNWLDRYCSRSDIEVFTEVIVYSSEIKVAGMVDILLYYKNDDTYEVIDWKTTKEIKTASFKNKMGIHPISSDLMDCNFNHYALQLSMYRYLLETYYGLNIKNQMIAHLNDEMCKTYVTPYYDKKIYSILSEIN